MLSLIFFASIKVILKMVRHHIKKHRVKLALGIPIAFLLASSLSFMRNPDEMCLVPEDNRFVEVGETVTLHVTAEADEPVNVVGAIIGYPHELVSVEDISRESSIIDLWTEEPYIDEENKIHFSGGIVSDTGFLGKGTIVSIVFKPTQEGTAEIYFEESKMLAHDGTGLEVTCDNYPITLSIRAEEYPNPDVNGDKSVNLFDFGIVSARLFMVYERPYDLNLDGKITIADIGVLISNLGK